MPDLKISQLPVASATTGAELFPVVQGGVTKQIALNAVRHIGSAVFDANGSMAVDTNTLFVDAVNNRVGVGTASPAVPFDVTGIFNGLQARFGNTAGRGLYVSTALNGGTNEGSVVLDARGAGSGQFLFQADSATKLTLDASGNLGLGVTPSASDLRLFQINLASTITAATNEINIGQNTTYAVGAWRYIGSTTASRYSQANSAHSWFTAPSGTAGAAISFTQAMTLDASGNLGVGVTSPAQRLEVAGRQRYSGSTVGASLENQITAISVTTNAVTIHDEAGSLGRLCVVNGSDGSNRFCDLVMASTSVAPTVVQSFTALGSPAARTYTRSGSALQVAMASGTYSVFTLALGF